MFICNSTSLKEKKHYFLEHFDINGITWARQYFLPSTVDSKFFNVILIKKFILSNPLNFLLVQLNMRPELCDKIVFTQNITKSKITYPSISQPVLSKAHFQRDSLVPQGPVSIQLQNVHFKKWLYCWGPNGYKIRDEKYVFRHRNVDS